MDERPRREAGPLVLPVGAVLPLLGAVVIVLAAQGSLPAGPGHARASMQTVAYAAVAPLVSACRGTVARRRGGSRQQAARAFVAASLPPVQWVTPAGAVLRIDRGGSDA